MSAGPELVVKFGADLDDFKKGAAEMQSILSGMEGNSRVISKTTNALLNLAKGYLTVSAAIAGGRFLYDSSVAVEKYEAQLNAATSSQEEYADSIKYVESIANRYNKNVLELGASYAKFTIATKGTNLEGAETKRIFEAVTAASTAMKLSTDETNGVFRAFIQMVSKGNVQAEELRGQLGERLYGAFNMAAKAMGVTTQELNQMLKDGKVLASDLLPKLATELENTFGLKAQQNAETLGSRVEYAHGQAALLANELFGRSGAKSWLSDAAEDAGTLLNKLRLVSEKHGIMAAGGALLASGAQNLGAGIANAMVPSVLGVEFRSSTTPWDHLIGSEMLGQSREQIAGMRGLWWNNKDNYYGQSEKKYKLPSQLDQVDFEAAQKEYEKQQAKLAKIKREAEQKQRDEERALKEKWAEEDALAEVEIFRKQSERLAKEAILLQERADRQVDYRNTGFGGYKVPQGATFKDGKQVYKMAGSLSEQEAKKALDLDKAMAKVEERLSGLDTGKIQLKWREVIKAQELNEEATKIEEALQRMSEHITAALREAAASLAYGFGELVGEMAAGGVGIEEMGQKMMAIFAQLLQDIGKALITFAAMVIASEATIENPWVALAAGIAAVAAGAFLKAKMTEGSGTLKRYAHSGIVSGRGGIDNVPALLTSGEMVLNKQDQTRMFGLIKGSMREGGSGGQPIIVYGQIRGRDIDISSERGKRSNRYFD